MDKQFAILSQFVASVEVLQRFPTVCGQQEKNTTWVILFCLPIIHVTSVTIESETQI